jgi:hypothetical protein
VAYGVLTLSQDEKNRITRGTEIKRDLKNFIFECY